MANHTYTVWTCDRCGKQLTRDDAPSMWKAITFYALPRLKAGRTLEWCEECWDRAVSSEPQPKEESDGK